MESYYQEPKEVFAEDHCDVRFEGPHIVVSYLGESGHVVYSGSEVGPGHYKLTAEAVSGRATLHRFDDSDNRLEGSWVEAGAKGMWRIFLSDKP